MTQPTSDAQAITQLAIAWINKRTELSRRLNSDLIIASTDNSREAFFQREFVKAHNDMTKQLIAILRINDMHVMQALGELIANAPRMLT